MPTIHQLPPEIISKIAAGEVIERPAYAVKELIENAIDAQADYITITIEDAGLKKIAITDNGIGMGKDDLLQSFKPHTTSKITTPDELSGIKTLGFRGEALSSIAAISKLTIRSRQESEETGNEIVIRDSIVEKIAPIGMPAGTTIFVEQLFHSVPPRKKFLKSTATEFRHIVEIVMQYALAFPEIRFFLTHNKKIVLDLPKNQSITERIKQLLGNDIFSQMISIETEDAYIQIAGHVSKPQLTTTTQSKQYIFINNRRIYDKAISFSIKEAYGNLLEPNSHPVFILFLTIPFEIVDVNVHPKKDQVNFTNKQTVLSFIQQSIKKTLETKNITFSLSRWKNDPLYDEQTNQLIKPRGGLMKSLAGNMLKDSVTPWDVRENINKEAPIEQIHNLYIIVQSDQGMLLIDQHAAHERILYEQFKKEFQESSEFFKQTALHKPRIIELSPSEKEILEEQKEIFIKLGFTIESFQGNSLIVSTIPSILKDRDVTTYIRELLDAFVEEKSEIAIDKQTNKILAYLACRTAIKAGEKLDKQQMKELTKKLEETKNNATCPHGRPTKIAITLNDLHRLFKRK